MNKTLAIIGASYLQLPLILKAKEMDAQEAATKKAAEEAAVLASYLM